MKKILLVVAALATFAFTQDKPVTPAQPSPAPAKTEATIKSIKPLTAEEKFSLRTSQRNLEDSRNAFVNARTQLATDQKTFEDTIAKIFSDRGVKAEEVLLCDGPGIEQNPCQSVKKNDLGLFLKPAEVKK